jgi:hypothetical protein
MIDFNALKEEFIEKILATSTKITLFEDFV